MANIVISVIIHHNIRITKEFAYLKILIINLFVGKRLIYSVFYIFKIVKL
ncbi:hypothetical protein EXN25_01105 [Clostridium botulinum]|nr:hypothetical protein [Clostridium botulinum]NFK35311.1 hypothetical protein [Clostridium botulinum H04402 065]NFB66210.1 hypothetical protein [Clostridium botulinum]NFB97008.1 hypothetical protein [Clostridium botulinum]NFC45827.1 hypothetical protein [Clostridium botulinum]